MVTKKASKKSSILNRIQPVSELKENLIMLVYGKADTGKTEFASTWPKPILFLGFNEKGMDTVVGKDGIDILELQTWDDLQDIYWELEAGMDYNTIVLDQITSMQGFAIDDMRRKMKKKEGELISQKNWGQVSGAMKTWIENFRNLSERYNLCFLGHERGFNSGDDEEDSVINPSIGAAIMPSVNNYITGAVTAIGNTFIRERWEVENKEEVRYIDFCMRTGPSAYYFTKIRRPVAAGPVDEFIVNPTYDKVRTLMAGGSLNKRKKSRRKTHGSKKQ